MILISLVGEQPIPGLLPLWQIPKFSAVVLAASKTTQAIAEQMSNAIKEDASTRRVEVLPIQDLEAYNLAAARRVISSIVNQYHRADQPVVINLTGGTKLMSLAALQAAFGSGAKLLYVSTETNELIWMNSDGAESAREPIHVSITVKQYLQAHGLIMKDGHHDPSKVGNLLEEEIYRQAYNSKAFDDVKRNVDIFKRTTNDQVKNELDVLVTRNGRLAVCSCKTSIITKETIYEIASLSRRESAGIYCGKVIACQVDSLKPALIERAKAMGVRLVYGSEINKIVEHLKAVTER